MSKMIMLHNFEELVNQFPTEESRMRWGVLCTPINYEGMYLLPLGWEEELIKENISFEIVDIEFKQEEIL